MFEKVFRHDIRYIKNSGNVFDGDNSTGVATNLHPFLPLINVLVSGISGLDRCAVPIAKTSAVFASQRIIAGSGKS